MALRYYDDVLAVKLKNWIPDNSNIRVLGPESTKQLFETQADDTNDKPLELPLITLSRNTDIELLSTTKQPRSYDGLVIEKNESTTMQLNVIPVKLNYQLDIYTKTYEQGDEYLRNFLFKLINNPTIVIEIPYNDAHILHRANIKVLPNVADTSSIAERIFPGQFTRWTIQFEIQDAFLFSVPYRKNWRMQLDDEFVEIGYIEVSNSMNEPGYETIPLEMTIRK